MFIFTHFSAFININTLLFSRRGNNFSIIEMCSKIIARILYGWSSNEDNHEDHIIDLKKINKKIRFFVKK